MSKIIGFQVISFPANGGKNYLKAFENEKDANYYADDLHASMIRDMEHYGSNYQPYIFGVHEIYEDGND